MSTVSDTENTESTENGESIERPEDHGSAENPENTEHTEHPELPELPEHDGDAEQPTADAQPESEVTSLYVRRGRTPTLGFWVALAIAVPAVAALLSAPFFQFADISGVLNFMLVAAVFVGLPLAAIAALVDAIRHRGEERRRR